MESATVKKEFYVQTLFSKTPAASCVKEFHAGTVVNAVPAEATAILECTDTQYEKINTAYSR